MLVNSPQVKKHTHFDFSVILNFLKISLFFQQIQTTNILV